MPEGTAAAQRRADAAAKKVRSEEREAEEGDHQASLGAGSNAKNVSTNRRHQSAKEINVKKPNLVIMLRRRRDLKRRRTATAFKMKAS